MPRGVRGGGDRLRGTGHAWPPSALARVRAKGILFSTSRERPEPSRGFLSRTELPSSDTPKGATRPCGRPRLPRRMHRTLFVTAVDGAAPAGDLIRLAKHWATFDHEEPYLLFALDGWSTAYGPILSRRGMEARTQIRRRCTGQLAWGTFGSDLIRGRSLAWHPWMDIARSNTPGAAPIDAPVLIQHGDRDELIPIESSQTRLRTLCTDLRRSSGCTRAQTTRSSIPHSPTRSRGSSTPSEGSRGSAPAMPNGAGGSPDGLEPQACRP